LDLIVSVRREMDNTSKISPPMKPFNRRTAR
jgi:hypothetical protein